MEGWASKQRQVDMECRWKGKDDVDGGVGKGGCATELRSRDGSVERKDGRRWRGNLWRLEVGMEVEGRRGEQHAGGVWE